MVDIIRAMEGYGAGNCAVTGGLRERLELGLGKWIDGKKCVLHSESPKHKEGNDEGGGRKGGKTHRILLPRLQITNTAQRRTTHCNIPNIKVSIFY